MSLYNLETDNLQAVELDGTGTTTSIFYIENTNKLKSTLTLFCFFIILHIIAAWKSPNLISLKQEYFDFNKTDGIAAVELDVILSSLLPTHKFVNVNGSIIRDLHSMPGNLSLPIEYAIKTDFYLNQTLKNSKETETKKATLEFETGNNISNQYDVLQEEITNFDTLQVKVTIKANVTNISGFLFTWSFANLSAAKYSRIACLLNSFLIGYMLVIFCSFIDLKTEAFTQIFCIIVGASGILSSNVITLFLPHTKGARVSDHVLMAAFIALYRLFLIMQLEMIRSRSTSPKIILLIVLGLFFAFYSTINAAANYDRGTFILESTTITDVVLPTEKINMEIHAIYAVICLVWIILAINQSNGYNNRRMHMIIFFTVLTLVATLVSEVLFPYLHAFQFSILPSLIIASTHVTSAAFTIFLLHNGFDPNYMPMDDMNQKGGSLDIEEISDDNKDLIEGGDKKDNDDDDDDEEEEEEEEEE